MIMIMQQSIIEATGSLNNVLSIIMAPNMLMLGHSENVYSEPLWQKYYNNYYDISCHEYKLNGTTWVLIIIIIIIVVGYVCMISLFLFKTLKLIINSPLAH